MGGKGTLGESIAAMLLSSIAHNQACRHGATERHGRAPAY